MDDAPAADPEEPDSRAQGAVLANVGGALGNVWLTWGAPTSLLLFLFAGEWLQAEKWQLGALLALNHLGPTIEPAGAWLAELWGRRKPLFLLTHLSQRLPFVIFAWLPLLEPTPANQRLALAVIFAVVVVTRLTGHLGSSAWWGWMGDLVPGGRRAAWLGCRFQCASAVTAGAFLVAGGLLQATGGLANTAVVSGLFLLGGLCGVADILCYCWVPEVPMARRTPADVRIFLCQALRPFRQVHFRRYLQGLGLWLFGVNLVVPYLPLYLKGHPEAGRAGLGVSWTYLAAFTVAGQLGTTLTSRWWGRLCPRLGAPTLFLLGGGHLFLHLTFLLVAPEAYQPWLVGSSLASGILFGAWQVGSQQWLYELAPVRGRGFYTAAYNMAVGWGTAAGALLGGWVADVLPTLPWVLPGGQPVAYLHVLLLAGCTAGATALGLLSRAVAPAGDQAGIKAAARPGVNERRALCPP